MKRYSLSELKFANELCYPADFRKLLHKHSTNTYWEDWWQSLDVSFRATHKADLISFIFSHSRRDFEDSGLGEVFENIIDDLIKN